MVLCGHCLILASLNGNIVECALGTGTPVLHGQSRYLSVPNDTLDVRRGDGKLLFAVVAPGFEDVVM